MDKAKPVVERAETTYIAVEILNEQTIGEGTVW